MSSQLDTLHYNQVAGKEMTAWFRDNEIYRNDVNGNVQTIYYMQDGEPPEITDVGFIESGDCSFYIEGKQVVQITYRQEPVWHITPLPKLDVYKRQAISRATRPSPAPEGGSFACVTCGESFRRG